MDEYGYANVVSKLLSYDTSPKDIIELIHVIYRCLTPPSDNECAHLYNLTIQEFDQWANTFTLLNNLDLNDDNIINIITQYNIGNMPKRHVAQCMLKAVIYLIAKKLTPDQEIHIQLSMLKKYMVADTPMALMFYVVPHT